MYVHVCHTLMNVEALTVRPIPSTQAIEALEGFPSATTRDILRDSVFDPNFYYCVRVQAARTLTKVRTCMSIIFLYTVHNKTKARLVQPSPYLSC